MSVPEKQTIKLDYVSSQGPIHLKGSDLSTWVTSEVRKIHASAYIPEEMVRGLQNKLSRDGTRFLNSTVTPEYLAGGRIGRDRSTVPGPTATAKLEAVAMSIAAIHYQYYRGLYRAMDQLLAEPGVPMQVRGQSKARASGDKRGSFFMNRAVPLSLTRFKEGNVSVPGGKRTLNVSSRWTTLSARTVAIKKLMGKESQVFWRHSGALSKVFHRHMLDQLQRVTHKSFIGNVTTQMDERDVADNIRRRSKEVKGKYYRRATVRMEVGIPNSGTVMDRIITEPLATGQQPRIGGLFRLNQTQFDLPELRRRKAGGRREGDANFYKIRQVSPGDGEKGIRKVLSPEFRRPWLRQLAAGANYSLNKDIRSLSFK